MSYFRHCCMVGCCKCLICADIQLWPYGLHDTQPMSSSHSWRYIALYEASSLDSDAVYRRSKSLGPIAVMEPISTITTLVLTGQSVVCLRKLAKPNFLVYRSACMPRRCPTASSRLLLNMISGSTTFTRRGMLCDTVHSPRRKVGTL
jgi:hypothetical protein